jgi:hypothetical protein
MGQQQVTQITCDRCKRVEHRSLSELRAAPKAGDKSHYVFMGTYKGDYAEFEDLCTGCLSIFDNHWREMTKVLQKSSPIRRKK